MPKYIIELTSANPVCPEQIEYEARDEAEAIRHYLAHYSSSINAMLVPQDGPQYEGWQKIELSIGPHPAPFGECEDCEFPLDSLDYPRCEDCQEADDDE